jgi:3-oxoacyl-[acyl-carrier-protein] synthase-3
MATSPRATITAMGHHVPPDTLTNEFFSARGDTSDAWIRARTGIAERHASRGPTSAMIVPAARECLARRGLDPGDLDLIIVCTSTPDHLMPSTAAIVQAGIGATRAWGFDLNAACSGFVFGLITAVRFIESRGAARVLVCAADRMTTITDYTDRQTSILFGDAAGVALVEATAAGGVLGCLAEMDGREAARIMVPAGGSARPATIETLRRREHAIRLDGGAVFRSAVASMSSTIQRLAADQRVHVADINWLVPHQANARILHAVADRLCVPPARVIMNVDRLGNTGAATVPTCLAEAHLDGRLQPGQLVGLVSFGAGFTSGAVLMRWTLAAPARGESAAAARVAATRR